MQDSNQGYDRLGVKTRSRLFQAYVSYGQLQTCGRMGLHSESTGRRHGNSDMSFVNSDSDHALAVLVRTFPSEPVASANLATLSPL